MSEPLPQARDRIAELCGYHYKVIASGKDAYWTLAGEPYCHCHPIPACLNFVSKVWPREVRWMKYNGQWRTDISRDVIETGDEFADRMTLLADVLAWLQSNDPPAFDAAVEKIRKEIQG